MDSILRTAQFAIKRAISVGDTVVDATVGNGIDTQFLARCVGAGGKVFGFDIQQVALDITHDLLERESLREQVQLICDGHERLAYHLGDEHTGQVSAAMFNLGYMPSGCKHIVTNPETTVDALCQAAGLLRRGGILSVVVYRGHEGAQEESNAVLRWARDLDQSRFEALRYEFVNQVNQPPFLLLIERL